MPSFVVSPVEPEYASQMCQWAASVPPIRAPLTLEWVLSLPSLPPLVLL